MARLHRLSRPRPCAERETTIRQGEQFLIDHVSTYAMDYPKARTFYDAAMEALGYPIQKELLSPMES